MLFLLVVKFISKQISVKLRRRYYEALLQSITKEGFNFTNIGDYALNILEERIQTYVVHSQPHEKEEIKAREKLRGVGEELREVARPPVLAQTPLQRSRAKKRAEAIEKLKQIEAERAERQTIESAKQNEENAMITLKMNEKRKNLLYEAEVMVSNITHQARPIDTYERKGITPKPKKEDGKRDIETESIYKLIGLPYNSSISVIKKKIEKIVSSSSYKTQLEQARLIEASAIFNNDITSKSYHDIYEYYMVVVGASDDLANIEALSVVKRIQAKENQFLQDERQEHERIAKIRREREEIERGKREEEDAKIATLKGEIKRIEDRDKYGGSRKRRRSRKPCKKTRKSLKKPRKKNQKTRKSKRFYTL
jgi:hypothetical protein